MDPRASINENGEEHLLPHWGLSPHQSYQLTYAEFSSPVKA